MLRRTLYLVFAVALLAITGCHSKVVKAPTHGTDTVIIDKSPVTGKELDKAAKPQLELNPELLAKCTLILPKPPKGGTSVDISALKKAETALYFKCAYMHNALIDFLDQKLGIRADDATGAK